MSKKEFGLPERTSITIITVAIAILSVNWFFTYYLPPAGNSLCDETVKIVDWNYDKAGTLNLKLSNLAQAGIVVVDVTANTGNEPQTISVNDVLASGSQTQFFSIPVLGTCGPRHKSAKPSC